MLGVCTKGIDDVCIITEFIDGGSLKDLINESTKLSMKTVLLMMKDIASGITQLHSENILHCDLAARNLLVPQFNLSGSKQKLMQNFRYPRKAKESML